MEILRIVLLVGVVIFFSVEVFGLIKDVVNKFKKKKQDKESDVDNKNKEN